MQDKSVEKVCAYLIRGTKEKNLKVKGQFRYLPRLRITTRKTCSDGSKTWDHSQKRIHKQLTDLHSPSEIIKQIICISIAPGLKIKVTIADALIILFNKLSVVNK